MTTIQQGPLRSHILWCLLALGLSLVPTGVLAQDTDEADADAGVADKDQVVEEVVVTGTRKAGMVPTETLSPVDVLSGEIFANQASSDLTDALSAVAPSFNTQRFPIADGTAFVRPVTLRNLSPDHTLVLINGTRRHRSAMVNLQLAPLGTVNQGSQAVDFSTLPASAIKRVEVLRDGASAQYGSDAIAGVVNVILNDNDEGFTFNVQSGQYYQGDGTRTTIGGDWGLHLTDQGFLNIAWEYSASDKTSRGVARPDAQQVASVVGASQTPFGGFGQRWGDPNVKIGKVFVNSALDVDERTTLYANASYARNKTISDFFYRGPVLDASHMFNARTTLQQDANGDYIPDDAPQALIDEIIASGLDPNDYLMPDPASPSGYVLRNPAYSRFPGGYNPDFGADINDFAVVMGGKGETDFGMTWDMRARVAENKIDYVISETINPSLGRLSPDSFRPGSLIQEESSFNSDFVQQFDVASLASPLNAAFGFEYRDETYKIGAGDNASIEAGPTAAIFGVGSDGFQGFPLESVGSFKSQSVAGYIDLEADISNRLSGGLAMRGENFDSFGSTFDWKTSGRFDVTEHMGLRGTASTGFRAPTPGQVNTLNVTTSADADGNLIPSGVYPVDHPVSQALGSTALKPENSTSFTVGFVSSPTSNTSVTLDYYNIKIKDRLALQNNTISAADIPELEAAGVQNAALLDGSLASFFTNAYDSDVNGIDFGISQRIDLAIGDVTVDFHHNWNQHNVTSVAAGTINDSRVFDIENQVPNNRSVLTVSYESHKRISGYVRANRYGQWMTTGGLFSPGDASDASTYKAKILVDLELRANLAENYVIALGGQNVFDTLPGAEQNGVLNFLGVENSLTSPFGFNGGLWYARVEANF